MINQKIKEEEEEEGEEEGGNPLVKERPPSPVNVIVVTGLRRGTELLPA